jgi:hypothetical protein
MRFTCEPRHVATADDLNIVAVRVEDEGAVIVGILMGSQPRRAIATAARGKRRFIEAESPDDIVPGLKLQNGVDTHICCRTGGLPRPRSSVRRRIRNRRSGGPTDHQDGIQQVPRRGPTCVLRGGAPVRVLYQGNRRQQEARLQPAPANAEGVFYSFFVKSMLRFDGGLLENARTDVDGSGDRSFRQELQAYLRSDRLLQLADMCTGAIARSYHLDRDEQFRWRKTRPEDRCARISAIDAAPLPYPWEPMERTPFGDSSGRGGGFSG